MMISKQSTIKRHIIKQHTNKPIASIKSLYIGFVLSLLILLTGCSAFNEYSTGLVLADNNQQQLTPCPAWPRCVSSDSHREERYIEPLKITGDPELAWQAAIKTVQAMERTRIITHDGNYLHAEIDSPWNFYIDDLELHLRPALSEIAVRSSGRIGYYDFEVNHKRIEQLRASLAAQGFIEAP